MLRWTLIFVVLAIIAGIFGFSSIAGTSAWIAQVLFGIFLLLLVISFIARALKGGSVT